MAVPPPTVRHFIACHRVVADAQRQTYSLDEIISVVRPVPGEPWPLRLPEMYLFAVLTDVQGIHEFSVQIVTWNAAGEEIEVWQTRKVSKDLGHDPLTVHGWPIRLRNLQFAHPGLYEFQLVCEATIIARETLMVRENP